MGRFLLTRVIQSIVTILVISMVVFLMARASGDPVVLLASDKATAQDIALLKQQLGLDQPVPIQYWVFITNAVRGNLGKSLADRGDVAQLIGERLPNSAAIGIPALFLSTVLGMAMGVAAAVKRDTWIDKSMRVVAVLGQSMPAFWVSIMAIFVFSVLLRILPTSGMGSPDHYILPIAVLTFFALPMRMRLMRSSLLEILNTEYVKQARAKGLSETAVVWRHAVRNALSPQLTSFGLTLAFAITGAVLVETVFSWPGLGLLAYQAMLARDYPLIQGTVLLVAVLTIGANLLVDVLYAYVDPRITY
ncbi:MAG: ABC transporter permease [Chloroflexi bacterium]|nr:ABC transporter permease [Chloroflexota bacterium]MBV9894914.1 ABC transporter permease [Chloroflexota bacterium]